MARWRIWTATLVVVVACALESAIALRLYRGPQAPAWAKVVPTLDPLIGATPGFRLAPVEQGVLRYERRSEPGIRVGDFSQPGATVTWRVALVRLGVVIEPGMTYTVFFRGRSIAPHTVRVRIARARPPWEALALDFDAHLTREPREFRLEFLGRQKSDGVLEIDLGENPPGIEFDAIELRSESGVLEPTLAWQFIASAPILGVRGSGSAARFRGRASGNRNVMAELVPNGALRTLQTAPESCHLADDWQEFRLSPDSSDSGAERMTLVATTHAPWLELQPPAWDAVVADAGAESLVIPTR